MSDRAARAHRRAEDRARARAVLDAVDPRAGGRAAHHVCLVPGCSRHAPAVELGPVVLTLCAEHKAELDRRWARAAARDAQASRRPVRTLTDASSEAWAAGRYPR